VAQALDSFYLNMDPEPPICDSWLSQFLNELKWNPTNLRRLFFLSTRSYESSLSIILSKCSASLKHLHIITSDSWHVSYPIDEILAICPQLLTFEIKKDEEAYSLQEPRYVDATGNYRPSYCGCITIRSGHSRSVSPSTRYPLRRITGYSKEDEIISVYRWLNEHCPRANRQISILPHRRLPFLQQYFIARY